MKKFERITVDPAQMGGVPCVRHLRIPVATVLRMLAGGLTEAEILSEYPDLQADDIRECLRFAAASAMERELPLPPLTLAGTARGLRMKEVAWFLRAQDQFNSSTAQDAAR